MERSERRWPWNVLLPLWGRIFTDLQSSSSACWAPKLSSRRGLLFCSSSPDRHRAFDGEILHPWVCLLELFLPPAFLGISSSWVPVALSQALDGPAPSPLRGEGAVLSTCCAPRSIRESAPHPLGCYQHILMCRYGAFLSGNELQSSKMKDKAQNGSGCY